MRKCIETIVLATFIVANMFQAASAGDSMIHSCVHPNGTVRFVDRGCAGSEHSVDWNAQGQMGPAGPTGASGTELQMHRVTGDIVSPDPGNYSADCPDGEFVISGSALYKPGLEIPFVALATEFVSDRTDGFTQSMNILFAYTDPSAAGTRIIRWTIVCAKQG